MCPLGNSKSSLMRQNHFLLSSQKKKEKLLEDELEQKIKILEAAHAASQEEHILADLRKVKLKLSGLINKKIQFQLQRLRLEKFEHSNKSSKFLANQLAINYLCS